MVVHCSLLCTVSGKAEVKKGGDFGGSKEAEETGEEVVTSTKVEPVLSGS